jgi:sugar O-acyltransferase (sialic acid O-acetyltransferase NeuD family)
MQDILIIGGGGHCKSVIDVIESTGEYKIYGIIDIKEKVGQKVLGYKIIGTDEDLEKYRNDIELAFIAVGFINSVELRVKIYDKLKQLNFKLPVVISPLAYVSKHSLIEEGTIVMHYAVINAGAKIGKNCIINTKALIEHDAIIEDFCHISTGAIINGGVIVGKYSFIGSNATTKQYIKIPENSFIKAGTVVK